MSVTLPTLGRLSLKVGNFLWREKVSQGGFVNKLSVPMRKEDNEALSEVRAALEKKLGKRLSNSETVRFMLRTLQATIPNNLKETGFLQ